VACAAVDIFRHAAELNLDDPHREGNVIVIDRPCRMLVTGDIHGNRSALNRVISFASLASDERCFVILQEILHGPPDPDSGQDRSIEQLMRAARLKIEHPRQVLFVLGNHDVAQVTGAEISKHGRGACKAFVEGVKSAFGDDADDVLDAIGQFIHSLPLAVRCPNGVMICHSLPTPNRMDQAGTEILARTIEQADMLRGGAAYLWVWGRRQTEEQIESLAEELGVEFFLMAHQHTEEGYTVLSPRGAVVVSDHNRGYIVEFRDDQHLCGDSLGEYLRPLATLGTH